MRKIILVSSLGGLVPCSFYSSILNEVKYENLSFVDFKNFTLISRRIIAFEKSGEHFD